MSVIMLSGYMGSGKDTVGSYLVKQGYKRLAFADCMKDEVAALYDIDRASLDTQEGKARSFQRLDVQQTVRGLLIQHAEAKRRANPRHWASLLAAQMTLDRRTDKFVITDFRFPTEYEVIRELGVKVRTCRIRRWARPPLEDVTERALDGFVHDVEILNDADLDHLHAQAEAVIRS